MEIQAIFVDYAAVFQRHIDKYVIQMPSDAGSSTVPNSNKKLQTW